MAEAVAPAAGAAGVTVSEPSGADSDASMVFSGGVPTRTLTGCGLDDLGPSRGVGLGERFT
ncbi:hypothetical protein D7X12_22230 [Corallococcus sicarius]|uniref:Uncharacterized protein n=1 Tax=Corallococcus sicarius TaxID=2316726 RepID=A0A3A8NIW3_9BACT|nr:hypothetical protein D7X12_22230 [Corallococcus sicarius]